MLFNGIYVHHFKDSGPTPRALKGPALSGLHWLDVLASCGPLAPACGGPHMANTLAACSGPLWAAHNGPTPSALKGPALRDLHCLDVHASCGLC